MDDYRGHKWIKVPRHKYDPDRSWEQNYRDLEIAPHPGDHIPDRQDPRTGGRTPRETERSRPLHEPPALPTKRPAAFRARGVQSFPAPRLRPRPRRAATCGPGSCQAGKEGQILHGVWRRVRHCGRPARQDVQSPMEPGADARVRGLTPARRDRASARPPGRPLTYDP